MGKARITQRTEGLLRTATIVTCLARTFVVETVGSPPARETISTIADASGQILLGNPAHAVTVGELDRLRQDGGHGRGQGGLPGARTIGRAVASDEVVEHDGVGDRGNSREERVGV